MGYLIAIVGAPFTGKTTSACTFPKPLTYFGFDSGGITAAQNAKDKSGNLIVSEADKIEVVDFTKTEISNLNFMTAEKADFAKGTVKDYTKGSIELMSKYNTEIHKTIEKKPQTLVIDSITTIFRIWKEAIMATNKIPALRIADYGTLEGILFGQFLPTLRTISMTIPWVICIGHETADKDELMGSISEFPIGPSANMGRLLAREFDEVWRQKIDGDTYLWRTKAHGLFVGAGSRFSLPDPVKPATFQELSKHIKL